METNQTETVTNNNFIHNLKNYKYIPSGVEDSNYILDGLKDIDEDKESKRLDEQNQSRHYRIMEELIPSDYSLFPNEHVLDAGCGSGEISNFLLSENEDVPFKLHMVDMNPTRIEDAVIKVKNDPRVNFSVNKLEDLRIQNNQFDKIFCRFVFQHLQNHQEVSNELYRVLKPAGELIITDVDGLLFNLVTDNKRLNELMRMLRKGLDNFEPYICGKIPSYLYKAGFNHNCVTSSYSIMKMITPADRVRETILFEKRFEQILPTLESILSASGANEFVDFFLLELNNPKSFIQYERRVIRAIKTK